MKYCVIEKGNFPRNQNGYAFSFARGKYICRSIEDYINNNIGDAHYAIDLFNSEAEAKEFIKEHWRNDLPSRFYVCHAESVMLWLAELKLRKI
jgi:hypothetical protein